MSNSDVVIRVEGLGKKYSLNHEQSERNTTLRDVVAHQAKASGRLLNPFTLAGQLRRAQRQAAQEHAASEEEFWALKDVSFEIRRGERVGIIGRNGAGKSTLLKILSRITEPTTGRVEIRGRVASLLEVGTGFHPELTGRENIYLNGAILGMTRWEIRSKFDEIVDFAEVEKFLDTPVKRYSSGMYVRLAFAVAAHLEPEILMVDEVLAVGDTNFQKKCLGKMDDIAQKQGRSIIFVSHQLSSVSNLCDKAIVLDKGKLTFTGSSQSCVAYYLDSQSSISKELNSFEAGPINSTGSRTVEFIDAMLVERVNRSSVKSLSSGKDYVLRMILNNNTSKAIKDVVLSYAIKDDQNKTTLLFRSTFEDVTFSLPPGPSAIESTLNKLPLVPSKYSIQLFCSARDTEILHLVNEALWFTVDKCLFYPSNSSGLPTHCKILVKTEWTTSNDKVLS
jgi:lipopolysaccharide transport system ATP-binding protein